MAESSAAYLFAGLALARAFLAAKLPRTPATCSESSSQTEPAWVMQAPYRLKVNSPPSTVPSIETCGWSFASKWWWSAWSFSWVFKSEIIFSKNSQQWLYWLIFLRRCTWQSVHQDLVNMYLLNSNVSLYILATLYLRFCLWKFVHYGLMLIKETRWTVLAIPFYLFEKQRETFDKLIPSYNVWNNMSSGPELSTSVRTFLQVGSSLSKIIEGHLGIFQGQQRLIGCWRLQSSNSWRQHLSAPWTFQVSGMWFYHGSQHALKHSSCTWSCHQRLPQHRTPHPKSLLEFLLWEARLKRFTSLKSTWSQKYAVYKVYVQF